MKTVYLRKGVIMTIEKHWEYFEKLGFIKEEFPGINTYSLPMHLGRGGFKILGNTKTVMATIANMELYKPMVILEAINEKYIELSYYHMGDASFYQKKDNQDFFDYGLNIYVSPPYIYGYKKTEANKPMISYGIFFRERFFEELPFDLPEDFWEAAASVLNPNVINIPSISLICDQIYNCKLVGMELEIYIYGKALETLAILLNYIYSNKEKNSLYLSKEDRIILNDVRLEIENNFIDPPSIKNLSSKHLINQQKLMAGFKSINGMTIYQYIKVWRMKEAFHLLADERLPIGKIREMVGYKGDGHFQKAFKEVYKLTPREARKNILKM